MMSDDWDGDVSDDEAAVAQVMILQTMRML